MLGLDAWDIAMACASTVMPETPGVPEPLVSAAARERVSDAGFQPARSLWISSKKLVGVSTKS